MRSSGPHANTGRPRGTCSYACRVPVSSERVLVLSASIGGGHVACAKALEAAFAACGVEAGHVDLLEHTAAPFRRLYRQAYFDLVRNVPDLVAWLGRRLGRRPTGTLTVERRLRSHGVRRVTCQLPRNLDRHHPPA